MDALMELGSIVDVPTFDDEVSQSAAYDTSS